MSKINLRGKKVLVTGAGGFIGSHLVELLQTLDIDIRLFIRYTSHGTLGNLNYLKNQDFDVIYGDLRNSQVVEKAMSDIDIVFHLASLISIPYSYVNPESYFDVNVKSILNILNTARELSTELIIHTSTSEVYGTAQFIPINETHPLVGQSPYSASKISADKVAESFYLSFDTPVVTIRPFNTYGPRQSTRAVIPTIIKQLLTSDTISLGDMTPTRDFLYVKDTVRGFVTSAEYGQNLLGGTYNLGTGEEISIENLVNLIAELMNKNPEIISDSEKIRPDKSEVQRLICDASLFNSKTDWFPKYNLQKGLEETINFYKAYETNFLRNSKFV